METVPPPHEPGTVHSLDAVMSTEAYTRRTLLDRTPRTPTVDSLELKKEKLPTVVSSQGWTGTTPKRLGDIIPSLRTQDVNTP